MECGLIVSNISNLYYVESKGQIYECTAKGKMKIEEKTPTVGDNVQIQILDIKNKKGIICDILDRNSYIKRPKLANLTQIIFVISLKMPSPDLLLLDKQLVYADFNNIRPIICINKIDLNSNNTLEEIEKLYKKIGYTVIKTNAKQKDGIDSLKQTLKNNITAFSGNSGVGKSTLINSIFEKKLTQEGVISEKIKKGKNTTTSVTLYKMDEKSYIADTPGFSTFDLTELEVKNLDKHFIEFRPYINTCQYIGCSHIKEQNCGVKKALEQEEISKQRYERYCKIYEDLKEMESHKWQ